MRESNFAFPAQNKACVCITSQLYDRRALDTSSPLPLFNSLTHLTYLTSTSPRIREIMTMDGGLERLVRILHDFCMAPPTPASPAAFYGLLPPSYRSPRPPPQINPPAGQFDKHAAYRFSLAFQCVVNIGVRGSEPIRSRVVQAGTLDVVGCILEAWLAGRGFAVGPSTSATGLPRETREARAARRAAAAAAAASRGRNEGETVATEPPAAPPERLLVINTSAVGSSRLANTPEDVYNSNYQDANNQVTRRSASNEVLTNSESTSSSGLRAARYGDDDLEAATPIVRDRSATVVVRRREGGRATENTNGSVQDHTSTSTSTDMNGLAQLHAAHLAAHYQGPPPSPSPSASSTTSARGSPSSTASTGARTRSRASSVASPVSRASPVSSNVSSSRASPSPSTRTDTDTDGDADGDVEMGAAGVAGMSAMGTTADLRAIQTVHGHAHREARGRVGDSSASASPSPPPLNRNMNIPQAGEQMPGMNMGANMAGINMIGANLNMMGMGGILGGGMGMMGMDGMGMMGLNRDPRIAGEEGGVGMGMGIVGEEGMGMGLEGDATNMMLNMGMMNGDDGMLGLDGGMGMLAGGMGMMGMNMNMNMGMNLGPLGMMGGMPLPMGMGDVSGSAGGDSEARADTDADAEESDAGANEHSNASALGSRRRGEDDTQTQTPRAGVVRLPSSSPEAGPSSAPSSSYEEEEGDLDEEESEDVAAVRGGSTDNSGAIRRTGTLRATSGRPPFPGSSSAISTSNAVEPRAANVMVGRIPSYRGRAEIARQPAASSSSVSVPLAPTIPAAPRASQHHTPHPGAPRVPAAPTPAVRPRRATAAEISQPAAPTAIPTAPLAPLPARDREDRHHHTHVHQTGPYRDEDVLLSLQLLAYLSKYPHVRQAFYKKRNGFHPASALAQAAAKVSDAVEQPPPKPEIVREKVRQTAFLRAFGVAGKEKEKGKAPATGSSRTVPIATPAAIPTTSRPYETNVFSLVERFTFRPSSSETDLPNPPPRLPPEIQYWAGVIMRNACRKDDSRGGIRQCANMLCGRWEEYPREFAKCRRCRKAKYCGKECQSTAWSEGHRFWCSAKEGDDAPDTSAVVSSASNMVATASIATITPNAPDLTTIIPPVGAERRERRYAAARERERAVAVATANAILGGNAIPSTVGSTASDAATIRGFRTDVNQTSVGTVFGGASAPPPASAVAGPSRERPAEPTAPVESTRTRAMALLRRTANPLGAIGSPPAPQRRERDREATNTYATFDTYMAERRRAEAAATSAGSSTSAPTATSGLRNLLHHPQPQNPADIDRYLASFASPPRRRVTRTGGDGSSSREPSGSGDQDNMVLE
ncbi:hypothetical protein GGX14DRAFT_655595 [Mycena pura]|uniref:MYND-type domain-containing protein n=1 Tax=Mycena pura TaxID=153505 RepID=A0AAD6Y848_9AGAR|nr:hypothetical protein GGX14DRAFT_655595 [Mycena pura]